MAFQNIFKRFDPDTPVREVANIDDMNFIRTIFNDIQGINCRIEKPVKQGMGWRIIVGDGSDVEIPPPIPTLYTTNFFIAEITASASGWNFTEKMHTASGFVEHPNARTGTAEEINGIESPDTGSYTFMAYVFESDDDKYSFAMPIPECNEDMAFDVLRVSEHGVPEWGCVRVE